jgi:carboxyl-terminal processing protease
MSRGRILFVLLSLALVVPLASSGVRRALAEDDDRDSLYKELSVFSEVLHLIRRAYVDEIQPERLLEAALDGAADALDPLSTFVPAESLEAYAAAREVGSGHSGLTVIKERGVAVVVAVAHGSPGEAAGIQGRDALVEIDGESTRLKPLWQIQSILAGKPGTRLEIEVMRRGQPHQMELGLAAYARRPVTLAEVDGAFKLRLHDCDPATVGEAERALGALVEAGGDRLLVDLRGLAGGDPSLAYGVGELFASGPLGALRDRSGELESFTGDAEPIWQGPMVVLIDRGTMGCAEVLATILRQAGDAQLVGLPSRGHAGRMEMLALSTGAGLLTTGAFYSGPDGEPLAQAIEPDTRVEDPLRLFDDDDEQPETDLILERGLELLRSLEPEPLKRAA